MVLSTRVVVPRQNNDELPLLSCCVISIIKAWNSEQQHTYNLQFCKIMRAHPALLCCFSPALKGDNYWSEDAQKGGSVRRRRFVGKKQRAERRWDVPACLNTVWKKALLEFKVKNFPPNTWRGGQIEANGEKENKVLVLIKAPRPLSVVLLRTSHTRSVSSFFLFHILISLFNWIWFAAWFMPIITLIIHEQRAIWLISRAKLKNT